MNAKNSKNIVRIILIQMLFNVAKNVVELRIKTSRMRHVNSFVHIAINTQNSRYQSRLRRIIRAFYRSRKAMAYRLLMPSLDQIDSMACDTATVRSSLQKATSKLRINPEANPQDLLFKEILKQWKPQKKAKLN